MGHRHNTLSDNVFRNSKYINTLEKALEITNFRKEYKEQYDIMLDIFKTLIKINNILFSDSNKNIYDKKIEILDTLTIALYGSLDSDDVDTGKYKYSTRTIKNLIDSYTRYLFNKFIKWYDYLSNINELDFVKKEVEEEMDDLRYVNFDSVIKKDISYKKNKDSDYKIYITKLDFLYSKQNEVFEEYKQEFYDTYGIKLQKRELDEIYFIYKLIASGNNALVNLLTDNCVTYEFNLSEYSTPEDYFDAYLYSLGTEIEDGERYKISCDIFSSEIVHNCEVSIDLAVRRDYSFVLLDIAPIDFVFSNYSLYFFYKHMSKITSTNYEFSVKSDILLKIVQDLKEVYNLMYENIFEGYMGSIDKEKLKKAWDIIQKIIKRNQNLFERVS